MPYVREYTHAHTHSSLYWRCKCQLGVLWIWWSRIILSTDHITKGRNSNVNTTGLVTYGNIFPDPNKLSFVDFVNMEDRDGLDTISRPPAWSAEPESKLFFVNKKKRGRGRDNGAENESMLCCANIHHQKKKYYMIACNLQNRRRKCLYVADICMICIFIKK